MVVGRSCVTVGDGVAGRVTVGRAVVVGREGAVDGPSRVTDGWGVDGREVAVCVGREGAWLTVGREVSLREAGAPKDCVRTVGCGVERTVGAERVTPVFPERDTAGGVARDVDVERGTSIPLLERGVGEADRAGDEYVREAPALPLEPRLVFPLFLSRARVVPAAIKAMAVMSVSFMLFMVPPSALAGRVRDQLNSSVKPLSVPRQAGVAVLRRPPYAALC